MAVSAGQVRGHAYSSYRPYVTGQLERSADRLTPGRQHRLPGMPDRGSGGSMSPPAREACTIHIDRRCGDRPPARRLRGRSGVRPAITQVRDSAGRARPTGHAHRQGYPHHPPQDAPELRPAPRGRGRYRARWLPRGQRQALPPPFAVPVRFFSSFSPRSGGIAREEFPRARVEWTSRKAEPGLTHPPSGADVSYGDGPAARDRPARPSARPNRSRMIDMSRR